MILNVAKISNANAEVIKNETFDNGQYFNPVKDANNNWVITLQEAQYLDRSGCYFSIIEWVAPAIEDNETTIL